MKSQEYIIKITLKDSLNPRMAMDNIHKNFDDYNPNKNHKVLITFDDMIADMISNKKTIN